MMESTQAAVRSRKSHHKSRSGCGNCKKRRIKVSDPPLDCPLLFYIYPGTSWTKDRNHVVSKRSKSFVLYFAVEITRSRGRRVKASMNLQLIAHSVTRRNQHVLNASTIPSNVTSCQQTPTLFRLHRHLSLRHQRHGSDSNHPNINPAEPHPQRQVRHL